MTIEERAAATCRRWRNAEGEWEWEMYFRCALFWEVLLRRTPIEHRTSTLARQAEISAEVEEINDRRRFEGKPPVNMLDYWLALLESGHDSGFVDEAWKAALWALISGDEEEAVTERCRRRADRHYAEALEDQMRVWEALSEEEKKWIGQIHKLER